MKAKRWISILLCILMIGTLFPVSAFAEEGSCAEEHDYVPEVTDPTCTAGGFTTYTCSRCGDSYTEPGEAMLGHAWDEGTITTEPTFENEGVRTFTCNRCGETNVEQIPKLEPIPEDNKVEGSADEGSCAEGHDYVPETTEPTCTADGFTTYTCSSCGDSYKVDGEVALGHSYDNGVTTDPTCTEAGFTTFTCTRCGDSYKVDGDATLGHSYDDGVITTEPTVDAEGVKTFTCVRCGHSYTETVPKLEPEQPVTKRLLAAPALRSLSDTVYTVILKAGGGTGSDVVIRSDEEGRMAASLQEATKGQFWDEGDNGVWFKLPDCPFTAPVNSSFVGWNGTNIGPGTSYKLTDTELTLTATWQENQENNADYALSVPLNVTLSGTGITEIPITATKLVLGKATSGAGGGYIDADVLYFMYTIDALKNSKGDTISCSYTHLDIDFRDVGTKTISVSFDPEVYASAAPGVYIGTLNYDCQWEETGGLTSPRFGSGSIGLMLNISAVDEYTVTLSPGRGAGNPITYSAAVEEIAESRQAAGNCQFYYENGGGLGFRLDEAYCPSTFTAPDGGYIFNGWDGSTGYISLTEASTVRMANWQKADITLVPSSITLTGAGDNTVTLEPKGPDGLRSVNISFKNGSLSNGTYEIPFTCSGEISLRATEITVTVDSSAFAAAAPGQYTGWLNYSGTWRVGASGVNNRFSGSLPVSLIVPERDQYTLTVTASPLEGGTVTGGGTYYENMSVTVTATANNGYAFVNWTGVDGLTFTSGSATTATAIFTMPANAVTVTATYENIPVVSYTVTYKVAGGTWADGTTEDKTETVTSGSSPASVPTGMIATSGYMDGAWDNDPADATITGDTTFTYTFEKNGAPDYTVSFDANVPASASTTSTGSMANQSFEYDETKALSENGYSLPGYEFNGWNTKTDGTGTAYADKAEVQGLSEDGGVVVLYAQWSGKPYTIEYWSDSAGSKKHVQTAYFDQPGKLDVYSDRAFGWDSGGKTLHGWSSTGFGSFLEDGDDFVNLCGAPDTDGNVADPVIVAEWVNNGQIVVTVTKDGTPQAGLAGCFKLLQGSIMFDTDPISYSNGKYIFNTTSMIGSGGEFTQLPEGEYDILFEANGYPPASARITYGNEHAVSVEFDYYTVSLTKDPVYTSFNNVKISGGEPVAGTSNTVVARDGDMLGIKTTVEQGYQFDNYSAVGVTPVWEGGDPTKAEQAIEVRGKTDITAHVSPVEYSVTVVGGSADVTTAHVGDTVTITANDAEYGYAFVQWAQLEGVDFAQGDGFTTTFTMPAKNVTVYAVFKEIILPDIADKTYTGEEIKPTFGLSDVTLDGVDAVFPERYVLTYENNIYVGTATVTLTFKDPVTGEADPSLGTRSTTFEITPADISTATVEAADQTYNGTALTPAATVTWNGQVLATDDYTLSYSDNMNVGQATITVAGKGNFNGTASGTFTIAPRPAVITVNNASKIQGEDDPAFSGTVEGLVADSDLGEVSYKRTNDDEAPGTYEGVLTAEYTENDNYDVSVTNGGFTIRKQLTVTWLDGDGSVLQTKTYGEGDEPPAYDGKTPTKAATAQYTYSFTGWDGGNVDGTITTKRPLFSETVNKYMVTFVDYDGKTVLKEAVLYDYGTAAADIALPDNPEREPDTQYMYAFTGWTPEIVDVTADAIYTAVYSSDKQSYTITWLQDDGTQIDQTTVEYGETPVHADPTKSADAQYTYTFAGWDPEITAITGDDTYKATYTKVPIPVKKGILTFDLAGGMLDGKTGTITIEANVGDVIKLPGTPVREGYSFQYWKGPEYEAGAEYTVEGDHTFMAVWEEDKAKTYIVTFDANGHGTAPAAQTVNSGDKAAEPAVLTESGFTFGGWFTEAACTTAFDFSTSITGNITLYAKWTEDSSPGEITYTVVSGADGRWPKGSGKYYEIIVKRSEADDTCYSHFTGVMIDGALLVYGTQYTAKAGSTVVTLNEAMLESLSMGGHTISIIFDDGMVITGLTIDPAEEPTTPEEPTKPEDPNKPDNPTQPEQPSDKNNPGVPGGNTDPRNPDNSNGPKNQGNPNTPQTGDVSNTTLWISLMILSVLGIAVLLFCLKKRTTRKDCR